MKTINLTQDKIAFVDDNDYEYLMNFKWYACKERTNFYARTTIDKKKIKMHHMLLGLFKDKEIDHKDGNGLNNQRDNLRICSRKQNGRNTKIRKDNSSGFKGVSFSKSREKFESKIAVNGKTIHLGRYNNAVDAAKSYDIAAIKYFGSFAKINNV